MSVSRLDEQDTLSEVEHDSVVNNVQSGSIYSLNSSHGVVIDLVVSSDLSVIVFTHAQNTIVLVLLNFVKSDKSIAALVIDGLCNDAILIVIAQSVHQNVGLG